MTNIFTYIIKRIIMTVPTLLAVVVITFFFGHWLPGNPFIYQIRRLSDAQWEIYLKDLERYGLNESLWTQFTLYVSNFISGDWGNSWVLARDVPATALIRSTLPTTIELMGFSIIISAILGKKIGTLAIRSNAKKKNQIVRLTSILISAIPVVVMGHFLVLISVRLRLYKYAQGLKSFGLSDPVYVTGSRLLDCLIGGKWPLFFDTLAHYVMPVFVLSLPMIVLIARQTRSSVMEVNYLDYIRTARAKGVPEKYIIRRHILPNSKIVTVGILGMAIPLFLSNAALVEIIFRLPGFASLLLSALTFRDYNVIVLCFIILAFVVVVGNTIVDIVTTIIDPRIRLQ